MDRIRLGTAPDSWGVWLPDDPRQTPWHRFLDEVCDAGYRWIELGPYGYLPTDPDQLADELGRRYLRLSGATVAGGLHRGGDAFDEALADSRAVARLITALGARYLVFLPDMYRDIDEAGTFVDEPALTAEQWRNLVDGLNRLGRIVAEEFGVSLVFHSHADSHVDIQDRIERLLADTDPQAVSLCLDTGHVAYCGGDNLALVSRYPDRIGYVHLKQVDPAVLVRVAKEQLSFAQAVRLGAMCEPPVGVPEMEPLLAALGNLDADLFAIVEQDLYPCDPAVPLPIATRTRRYFNRCGLGPVHAELKEARP